ncbi:hypothetical protein E4U59_005864 [Claviceps monticola]|nr:hypothetical protein E4U59_005864 [Claviceps monticola]
MSTSIIFVYTTHRDLPNYSLQIKSTEVIINLIPHHAFRHDCLPNDHSHYPVDPRGCDFPLLVSLCLQLDDSRNGLGIQLGAHKARLQAQLCGRGMLFTSSNADYDSGTGRCVPIGGNTLDGDQWLADCRQAGTADGYYRYKKDDTLDLSVTLWHVRIHVWHIATK